MALVVQCPHEAAVDYARAKAHKDRNMMKMGVWIAGICFSAYFLVLLWWFLAVGNYAAGIWNLPSWSLFVGVPLGSIWLLYAAFVLCKVSRPWFLGLAVCASLLCVPLVLQPWNPRVQFVRKLENLKGKPASEAQVEMKNYIGGELKLIEPKFVPDEFAGLGITHSLSFRWNAIDGRYNADVGIAYVANGIVVGSSFSPD